MTAPEAESDAIAWHDGTILAIGRAALEAAAAAGIAAEDAGGRLVLPGFVDAHMHLLHVGLKRTRPDLRGAPSKHEALQRVAAWLARHPGTGPVIGEGWDESDWPDGRPHRDELDALTARPLVLRRICGHVAVANSAALPAVQARWGPPLVEPATGLLLEGPSLYLNEVLPASEEEIDRAVDVACRVAQRLGVTSLGDYEQTPMRAGLLRAARRGTLGVRVACSIYVQALEQAIAEGFRTGRVHAQDAAPVDAAGGKATAAPEGTGTAAPGAGGMRAAGAMQASAGSRGRAAGTSEPGTSEPGTARAAARTPVMPDAQERGAGAWPMLVDGGLKVFLDGSIGGHTAHLQAPYEDVHSHGMANHTDEELGRIFERAHAAGIQIHAHAIGDAAIEQGLRAFERLEQVAIQARDGLPAGRHRDAPASGRDRDAPAWSRGGDAQAGPEAPGPTQAELPHRFEHYEIVHPDQLRRTVALGMWISSQPNFVGEWSGAGGMYEQRMGARYRLNNRFADYLAARAKLAFGSDGMPFGPLFGLACALQHPDPGQRLGIRQAIWHYTHASAESLGLPSGRLEPGRPADLLIIDGSLDQPPTTWTIQETVLGGRTVCRGDAATPTDDDVVMDGALFAREGSPAQTGA